ncbi:MAG: phage holin family protein [Bacteroidota bacterium]
MKFLIIPLKALVNTLPAVFKFIGANIYKFLVWLFCVYLMPTYELIAVTLLLLLADMATGIWKSLKTGVPVTAAKIGVTVEKMFAYLIGIICAYLVQHHITNDLVKVMLFFSAIISLKELKSIVENIEVITDTKIWTLLVKQIGNLLPGKKSGNEDKETKDETK